MFSEWCQRQNVIMQASVLDSLLISLSYLLIQRCHGQTVMRLSLAPSPPPLYTYHIYAECRTQTSCNHTCKATMNHTQMQQTMCKGAPIQRRCIRSANCKIKKVLGTFMHSPFTSAICKYVDSCCVTGAQSKSLSLSLSGNDFFLS